MSFKYRQVYRLQPVLCAWQTIAKVFENFVVTVGNSLHDLDDVN